MPIHFGSRRFFLWPHPTDMRKSFAGLCGIVSSKMNGRLLSGDVFVFINRRADRMKLLCWDRSGFVIWYKWLEAGTFELPAHKGKTLELKQAQLMLILEGISLKSVRHRKRYTRL